MGKSTAVTKADAKAEVNNTVTEYVVKRGKVAVGHACNKGQLFGVIAGITQADKQSGIATGDLKIIERTVCFDACETVPTGEDSISERGTVTETEITL